MTMNSETEEKILQASPGNRTSKQKKGKQHGRKASLDDVEQAFLRALLIDNLPAAQTAAEPTTNTKGPSLTFGSIPSERSSSEHTAGAERVLDVDILFTVPECLVANIKSRNKQPSSPSKRPNVIKRPEDYRFHVGLWQAHEDGVTPKVLNRMASSMSAIDDLEKKEHATTRRSDSKCEDDGSLDSDDLDGDSISSENELRGSAVSWHDSHQALAHFDAWQVLKDEYAQEHGFDYKPNGHFVDDSELSHNTFKILGTSADDTSSHPHVVSPPLLDSIMNSLPDVSSFILP